MISVCMATYNGEKYIREQMESILHQLGPNDEVIVSDDMSTDETLNIIRQLQDDRIRIFIHEDNHGPTKNFENALRMAKGDIIFLSDQDDIWAENKVSVTCDTLRTADFMVSDCATINDKLEIIDPSRFETFHIKKGFIRLMIHTRYLGCCMAFRKSVLNAALPFPAKSFHMEHDLWLAAVAELYFKVSLIREPLIYYRRHDNNASDGGFAKGYSLYNKIYRRLYRLACLLKIRRRVALIQKEKNQ